MTGLTLSHYRVDAELGRGGMGIVYKATDTKLNRTVALKVLPAAALASEDDRVRFFREAQSAAALHHPNIATVFQIDEAVPVSETGGMVEGHTEPRLFIAMEYIEGDTLYDRVKQGPLPLKVAVNIAGQIAEALKEAHAKDIVHRDIKSQNVMLTRDGVAKVLDFGLAKTNQSTMLTRMGSTLGTVAYMSPEQARGQEVDGRTDLYALGTVLYELVAGRLPFAGDYEQAVLYAILNEPPEPLTALRTGVPMELERITGKLLSKEAEYRYQTAADLVSDLKSLNLSASGVSRQSMTSAGTVAAPSGKAVLPIRVMGLVVAALLFGAVGAWLIKPSAKPDTVPIVRSLKMEFPGITGLAWPSVSNDGRSIAFQGQDSLYRRQLFAADVETGAVRVVSGGVGARPLFSPDDSRILFRDNNNVYSIPSSGGTPLLVSEGGNWASWLLDGSIVYTLENGLWIYPASGDPARQITSADTTREINHSKARALPDRQYVLFEIGIRDEWSEIGILDLRSETYESLGKGSRPEYLPSGHLLFGDGSNSWSGPLMVRPFDPASRRFTGPAIAVRQSAPIWTYSIGPQGTLYSLQDDGTVSDEWYLYRLGEDGALSDVIYQGDIENPRLSPDGGRVAINVEGGSDDWATVLDLASGVETRLNFEGDADAYAWSGDGSRLILERGGGLAIWSPDGGGLLETLPMTAVVDLDWSPDGELLAYTTAGGLHLYTMSTGGDTLIDASNARWPRFSPNGRFIAFTQDASGDSRSAVRAVEGSGFWRLSVEAPRDRRPVWSPDGAFIYLDTYPNVLARIPVATDGDFRQSGRAEEVYPVRSPFAMDVAPDGSVYLITAATQSGRTENAVSLDVTVNWTERLRRLAPPVAN